jgi:hypothetical protein
MGCMHGLSYCKGDSSVGRVLSYLIRCGSYREQKDGMTADGMDRYGCGQDAEAISGRSLIGVGRKGFVYVNLIVHMLVVWYPLQLFWQNHKQLLRCTIGVCTQSEVVSAKHPVTVLTTALPPFRQVFPPSILVTKRISSHPSSNIPVCHISIIRLSPPLTGAANRA